MKYMSGPGRRTICKQGTAWHDVQEFGGMNARSEQEFPLVFQDAWRSLGCLRREGTCWQLSSNGAMQCGSEQQLNRQLFERPGVPSVPGM